MNILKKQSNKIIDFNENRNDKHWYMKYYSDKDTKIKQQYWYKISYLLDQSRDSISNSAK